MTTLDIHNPDQGATIQDALESYSPLEAQEWEASSEVQEIAAHVPIVQLNTPPGARNGLHYTALASTTVNPVQLLIGRDYDRVKAFVTAVDYPIVIAQSQQQAQNSFNAGQAVTNPASTYTYTGAAGTFTAAGGSAQLPLYTSTQYLTGFDINAGLAATAGLCTVTVSDVVNGNYVYSFYESTTTSTGLSIRYPGNGVTGSGGDPLVTVSAVTSGASGNISVYGLNQSAQVSAASATPPSGQYVLAGTTVTIEHCDEIWLAACSTSLGRVAVEVCRTERASA